MVDNGQVFKPDDWTSTFADGLTILAKRGSLDGQKLLELGSGSGVVMLGLMAGLKHLYTQPPSYIGLDITAQSLQTCRELAQLHGLNGHVSLLQSNLLASLTTAQSEDVDKVVACLPQVAADRALQPREMGDYYQRAADRAKWLPEDQYGLGLLARTLDQMRDKTPRASAVFIVAGRQGGLVDQLFIDHGFPNIENLTGTRIIAHDPGTSVESFAWWEQESGQSSRFFADASGQDMINAAEAEKLRLANERIYHEIMVLEASR